MSVAAHPVTSAMWGYQQGSYRVLPEYLEAREGRFLTPEEFDDFRRIAGAIARTLEPLPRLDELVARAGADALAAGDVGLKLE